MASKRQLKQLSEREPDGCMNEAFPQTTSCCLTQHEDRGPKTCNLICSNYFHDTHRLAGETSSCGHDPRLSCTDPCSLAPHTGLTFRIIFPKCVLAAMRRCASAALSSGSTLSMTGLMSPCLISSAKSCRSPSTSVAFNKDERSFREKTRRHYAGCPRLLLRLKHNTYTALGRSDVHITMTAEGLSDV